MYQNPYLSHAPWIEQPEERSRNHQVQVNVGLTTTDYGTVLRSRGRQTLSLWLRLLATFAFVLATLLYTFFSSSSKHPITIFTHPEHTILILIIGSTISTALLGKLFLDSSELLRWSLASRPEGVGLATFLALSSTTGTSGVLGLAFSSQNGVGHQKWCAQRYSSKDASSHCSLIHQLFRIALSVVLLSNPAFETSYKQIGPTNQVIAGLAPFNISIPGIAEETQGLFTYYVHSFLANPQITAVVDPPINVPNHFSYILPGPLQKVSIMDLGGPKIVTPLDLTAKQRDDANAFLVIGAPGYQLDFLPIDKELVFQDQIDCHVYDDSLQICVKNTNTGDLIAGEPFFPGPLTYVGWTACSAAKNECTPTSDQWSSHLKTAVTLQLSSLKTQTSYDLTNASIQDVIPLSPPIPVVYPAQDILKVFDLAFGVPPGQNVSALLSTVFWTINANSLSNRQSDLEAQLLRNVLAVPLYLYNYGTMALNITDDTSEMHVTGHLVETKYRITVADWSLYTFMVLAEIVLFWCLFVLVYALLLGGTMPNTSDYLEWDVAAKCVGRNRDLEEMMRGTGNATGSLIRRRMRGYKVFVGSIMNRDGYNEVVLRVRKSKAGSGVKSLEEGIRYG
jgi:hypothetical protein